MFEQEINPLLILKSLGNKSPSGRKLREYRHKVNINKIHQVTNELIKTHMPSLAFKPFKPENYCVEIDTLLDEIKSGFDRIFEYGTARNYLARFIEQGNKEGLWDLEPPEVIVKLRRDRQLRTLQWHNRATKISEFADKFESTLNRPEDFDNLDSDDHLSIIALCATLYGGLNTDESIVALMNKIQDKQPIQRGIIGNHEYLWIDLLLYNSVIHNTRLDDQPIRIKRWFIDHISLGAIHRYFTVKNSSKNSIYNKQSSLIQISKTLKTLGIKFPFKSLSPFCRCAFSVAEYLPNVEISSALLESSIDRTLTTSLPPEYWHGIISPKLSRIPPLKYSDYARFTFSKNAGTSNNSKCTNKDIRDVTSTLNKALARKDEHDHKITPQSALSKLDEIDLSDWNSAACCLIDWYRYLLKDRKLTVSTVFRYHTEIANHWLEADIKHNLENLDPDSFYSVYSHIIRLKKSIKAQQYRAKRLEALHTFAVNHYNFMPLVEPLTQKGRAIPMVRAGYIPKPLFDATIFTIGEITDLNSTDRLCLQAFTTVAYRAALRLSELIKLRLCDIEESDDLILSIRTNLYADNKSDAALRKIPLRTTLTEKELKTVSHYINHRKKMSASSKELLFCQDGLPYQPWDGQQVSRLITDILRQISGIDNYVFHHFRHTALNNIHLIAEREWDLVKKITDYELEEITAIYEAIMGSDSEELRKYWAIACFSGHNSPQTSFRDYLHFTDLVIHKKLSRCMKTLNINQCKSLTGLSSNKLTRLIKSQNGQRDRYLVRNLRETLTCNLKPWITSHLPKTKDSTPNDNRQNHIALKAAATHAVMYNILSDYQKGDSIADLVYQYNWSEETIEKWLNNAKFLTTLKTRSGKSRLFSSGRKNTKRTLLLPAHPLTDAEIKDANSILSALRQDYEAHSQSIRRSIHHFLLYSTTSSSGIRFNTKDSLKVFLKGMSRAIPANRWLLIIKSSRFTSDQNTLDHWQSEDKITLKLDINSNKASKTHTAYLHLRHPKEKALLESNGKNGKHSASTLRYVMHCIAIMTLKEEDFENLRHNSE